MAFGSVHWGSAPSGALPATPTVPAVLFGTDTFRGGGPFAVLSTDQVANSGRDVQFNALTLPTGWVAEGDGIITPTTNGVVLRTKHTASSTAAIRSPNADYLNFDCTVDVTPLLPVDDPSAAVELIAIEHDMGGGRIVRVGLRRGLGTDPDRLVAFGEHTDTSGATVDGGVRAAPTTGRLALQLVRNGTQLYGLVGVRDPRTRIFSTLIQVFEGTTTSTLSGSIRVVARSLTATTVASGRVSGFTIESHATINGRLIVDKLVASAKQLQGFVPAATVFEVGFAQVSVFGLFGSESSSVGFQYTTPEPKTLGTEVVRRLLTYADTTLRDT